MANLMELVRELKSLNARKKAGEQLTPVEDARRKELMGFLRSTLEAQGNVGSFDGSGVGRAVPARGQSVPMGLPVPSVPGASPSSTARPSPRPIAPVAMPPANETSAARPPPRPVASPPRPPPSETPQAPARPPPLLVPAPPRAAPAEAPPAQSPRGFMEEALPPLPKRREPPPLTPPPLTPPPFVPPKDRFAIADVGALIDEAMSSAAVAKVAPSANVAAAEQTPQAPTLQEAARPAAMPMGGYTPRDDDFVNEQYYGAFGDEGYTAVSAADAGNLKPIDPRELELSKLDVAAGPSGGTTNAAVPAGLAFLDDFPALYARRVLPAPDDEVAIDSDDPNLLIPGKRKVTVHLLNGEKRQGSIRALRRGELGFRLEPLGSGQTEEISIAQVKAVFIHQQASATLQAAAGRALTATFRDGRAVQGLSDDYQPGAPVFTLVPPAGRGQFERIIVNGAAVQSVR